MFNTHLFSIQYGPYTGWAKKTAQCWPKTVKFGTLLAATFVNISATINNKKLSYRLETGRQQRISL